MKRQTYAIASEILYAALSGVQKTRLQYSCNLGQEMCNKYISSLLGNGLLEKRYKEFYTTKKGIKFIETFQKLEDLWKIT